MKLRPAWASVILLTTGAAAYWVSVALAQWRLWESWHETDPSGAELYMANAQVFGAAAVLAFIVAGAVLWRIPVDPRETAERPMRRRRARWLIAAGGVVLGVAVYQAGEWLAVDQCLDRGGRWDYASSVCITGS